MTSVRSLPVLLLLLCACSPAPDPRPETGSRGPAHVRPEVVERHTQEFVTDLADRPAGSQAELAAATYVLGHLQQAGYTVRLDSVPVGDLVRSTNVVALAPSGKPPDAVVTVAYDSAPGDRAPAARAIGVFLEVARALRVRAPQHSVEFVGLGAENTARSGGHLGSRRLAKLLLERGERPVVITVVEVRKGGRVCARGFDAASLVDRAHGAPCEPAQGRSGAVARAGLPHLLVGGGESALGRALLHYLATM